MDLASEPKDRPEPEPNELASRASTKCIARHPIRIPHSLIDRHAYSFIPLGLLDVMPPVCREVQPFALSHCDSDRPQRLVFARCQRGGIDRRPWNSGIAWVERHLQTPVQNPTVRCSHVKLGCMAGTSSKWLNSGRMICCASHAHDPVGTLQSDSAR